MVNFTVQKRKILIGRPRNIQGPKKLMPGYDKLLQICILRLID